MKQTYSPSVKQVSSKKDPGQESFTIGFSFLKRIIVCFVILQIYMAICGFKVFGQDVALTGTVVNTNQEPVSNVRVSLQSVADIFSYSDAAGNFSLVINELGLNDILADHESVYLLGNGGLVINAKNTSLHISIFDLMGRNMGTIIEEKNLSGKYNVYPSAYIKELAKGIYLAHVKLGNYQKTIKFFNIDTQSSSRGLHYIGASETSLEQQTLSRSGLDARAEHTVVFEHDFYKTTLALTSNPISDLGIVELENFGDYTIPPDMVPDKADLYNRSGTVLNLLGKDSTEFTLHFKPYSIFTEKLTLKAIPIDELQGLDSGIELISAVHLEPSGTKFNLTAMAHLDLKDISTLDNLVVFLYDDINDKTYYIPYYDQSTTDSNSIAFYLTHFSDIGIGYQPNIPENPSTPVTSDDFVSEITHLINLGEVVPDALFVTWAQQIVLPAIDAVTNTENLNTAVFEYLQLSTYINYVGKNISEFSFYSGLISNLESKINYVFDIINNECQSSSDLCVKKDLAYIALTVVQISQQLADITPLDVYDICNGEVTEIVVDFILNEATINIDVNEQKPITYTLYDILKQEIDSGVIDPEFAWYSEDSSIASVNQEGVLTGVSQGTVKVFAEFCDIKRYILVNVEEDIGYCASDTNTYSGSANSYRYDKDPVTGSSVTVNRTITITANLNDDTYEGQWFTHVEVVFYEWVGGVGYVLADISIENQSGQLQGDLYCNAQPLAGLPHYSPIQDSIWHITLFPESSRIKFWHGEDNGEGILTPVN